MTFVLVLTLTLVVSMLFMLPVVVLARREVSRTPPDERKPKSPSSWWNVIIWAVVMTIGGIVALTFDGWLR